MSDETKDIKRWTARRKAEVVTESKSADAFHLSVHYPFESLSRAIK